MSRAQHLSNVVQLPRQGRILALASTTTTAWIDTQAEVSAAGAVSSRPGKPWCGGFVAIQADGADVYVALTTGNASPANDLNPATNSSSAASPGTAICMKIPDGQTVHVWIEEGSHRYLAHRTASGSGQIRLWPSSRKELFGLDG